MLFRSGIWNLVAKINLALAAGIALPLLAALGYTPGMTSHQDILILAYVALPLFVKFLALILLYRWRHSLSISD